MGGPDRRAEDAGKLTIFLDEVLDPCGRGHPSFQNDEEPDAGLIEVFDGDSEFINAGSGRKRDTRQMFSASDRPVQ